MRQGAKFQEKALRAFIVLSHHGYIHSVNTSALSIPYTIRYSGRTCQFQHRAILPSVGASSAVERYFTTSRTMSNINGAAPAVSQSLTDLFTKAEAEFPPRFREHGWYLTVARTFYNSLLRRLSDAKGFNHSSLRPVTDSGDVIARLVCWHRAAATCRSPI